MKKKQISKKKDTKKPLVGKKSVAVGGVSGGRSKVSHPLQKSSLKKQGKLILSEQGSRIKGGAIQKRPKDSAVVTVVSKRPAPKDIQITIQNDRAKK